MTRKKKLSELEEDYRRYLQQVRALGPDSVKLRLWVFRRFANFLNAGKIHAVRQLGLEQAYEFLETLGVGRRHSYVKSIHASVKSIFRFLYFGRLLPHDFAEMMLKPRSWKLAGLPRGLASEEVALVMQSLRIETWQDHRERAVILLFLYYGLRRGEVARLSHEDIDWRKNTIAIPKRKNFVPLILPLVPAVAEALRSYLAHPETAPRATWKRYARAGNIPVFLLRGPAIGCLVSEFMQRCRLKGSSGAFRHTLATRLINNQLPLHTLQALLGHTVSETTLIYAKVDLHSLREVAENDSLFL